MIMMMMMMMIMMMMLLLLLLMMMMMMMMQTSSYPALFRYYCRTTIHEKQSERDRAYGCSIGR